MKRGLSVLGTHNPAAFRIMPGEADSRDDSSCATKAFQMAVNDNDTISDCELVHVQSALMKFTRLLRIRPYPAGAFALILTDLTSG